MELNLFQDTAQDMPLFSGTPQRAKMQTFKPSEAIRQPSMFATACPVCYGTHEVKNKKGRIVPCMFCQK